MKKCLTTAIGLILVLMLIIPTGCTEPAEFKVSALNISPAEVVSGESTNISVEVTNIGGSEGTYTVTLKVDGFAVKTKDVTLAADAIETLRWQIAEDIGKHQVGIDGLTGSFKVLTPAEFEVINIDINPNPVKVGGETKIMITIENFGEAQGVYNANLLVDGLIEQEKKVSMTGGATRPAYFKVIKDTPGDYLIEIGGMGSILEVIQPMRLETGTTLVKDMSVGKGKLEIDSWLDLDVVVALSSVENPEIPRLAFYIQSYDSYTATRIRRGTYIIYLALGEDWYEDSKKFLTNVTYHRYKGELEFVETKRKRITWYLTLDQDIVEVLYELVSEDEFPKLV